MRIETWTMAAAVSACCALAGAARADEASEAAAPAWDMAGVGRTIAAARQAHAEGDLAAAERLCHAAFESVDRSVLAAYDAYADASRAAHRADEAEIRSQAEKLHALRAERETQTQPTSTYLGFAPSDGIDAYAEMLRASRHAADAERMHSLALAYKQVQQAQFQRTMLYRQGKDPRGAC